MSIMLTEALKELALRPGESRFVMVDGYPVEIRRPQFVVHDEGPMVDIWLDVPPSSRAVTMVVSRGAPQLPAPIEITDSDLVPE